MVEESKWERVRLPTQLWTEYKAGEDCLPATSCLCIYLWMGVVTACVVMHQCIDSIVFYVIHFGLVIVFCLLMTNNTVLSGPDVRISCMLPNSVLIGWPWKQVECYIKFSQWNIPPPAFWPLVAILWSLVWNLLLSFCLCNWSSAWKMSALLHHFYSARNARIASAVLATAIPSVRPSHAGIVSKRRHVARCSLHCWIAKCV